MKAAALEFNCQIVHFMIVLPKKTYISKTSIKHVFSTIFSTVLELLQTVYREKTELQVVTNHSVHHRWKTFLPSGSQERDHSVPQQHKNFLVAGAKKAKSHINGCLVTLLLDLVFSVFILHKFPEHTFWNGRFEHIKMH